MKCYRCFCQYESEMICPKCGYTSRNEKTETRGLEEGILLHNGLPLNRNILDIYIETNPDFSYLKEQIENFEISNVNH